MISHYKQFRTENLRLQSRDYSQPGYYFITLCINNRAKILGSIDHGKMILNKYGCIVEECWLDLVRHYQDMQLDKHMIMPNHFHGIIRILDPVEPHKHYGLSEFVRALKTFSSRRINESRNTIGRPIWQSGYYDRIIRDDGSLQRIREYILNNPAKWNNDRFYEL